MKTSIKASFVLAAALGLAACSDKAQNEAAEAANAIGGDVQSTIDNAAADVANVSVDAVGAAENVADATGAAAANTAAKAKDATANVLDKAGDKLKEGANEVAH